MLLPITSHGISSHYPFICIEKDTYILDVGCISGKIAGHIARKYGSHVVRIDIGWSAEL